MSIEIKLVKTRRDLRRFVGFPETLYRHNPNYVPPLFFDQMDTLDPVKGAALEFCESALYLAYRDGKMVGRVAAIVNNKANEQWDHKEVRFGWYDFIEDPEVAQALMEKVYEFGRERGMESVVGPLGFTDLDSEGLLIEGYEYSSTMSEMYHAPYYKGFIEAMGFVKDADWVDFKLKVPDQMAERWPRMAKIIQERANVHLRPLTRRIMRKEKYGEKLFKCINDCYKDLYNYTVLPDKMSKHYLDAYLSILDLRFVSMVENERGELVAFGITMPSIVKALHKCRGKLFPFGWFHLLRSLFLKFEGGAELLLVGVRPEYQNSGINSLLFMDMFRKYHELGITWADTNIVLETNVKHLGQIRDFEQSCPRRRRSFKKQLEY